MGDKTQMDARMNEMLRPRPQKTPIPHPSLENVSPEAASLASIRIRIQILSNFMLGGGMGGRWT
jgi:hypothetical protein